MSVFHEAEPRMKFGNVRLLVLLRPLRIKTHDRGMIKWMDILNRNALL